MREDLSSVFTNIFNTNRWKSLETKSGPGSEIIQTENIRKYLPKIISDFNIDTILDAPCGDFNWMKKLQIWKYVKQYTGYDIVEKIIEQNSALFTRDNVHFECKNIVCDELEKADLIICRECLVHLQIQDIIDSLNNFKRSGSKYLLLTNYSNITVNKETYDGHWRALNFEIEPFNFPTPLCTISEEYTKDGSFPGKNICLWKISDL